MILYRRDDIVYFEDGNDKIYVHISDLSIKDLGANKAEIQIEYLKPIIRQSAVSSIVDNKGNAYGPTVKDLVFAFSDGMDTNWQDQTTDVIIAKFNQVHNSTTLNGAVSIGDYDIIVTSATGIIVGSYIVLFDPASIRFSTYIAVTVVSTTITLDTPIDFDYPNGTFVDVAITEMGVDGSGTPQIFGLRGTGAPPGIDLDVDITRIIFKCKTDSAVSLDLFGDIAKLTNGLVLRERNGRYHNIFNVKTNGELAAIMYDWTPYLATNPAQGQDGFVARLTFAGPDKIGVAVRLPIGTDLEFIIQDDLTDLASFEITAEGHIVEP